MSIRPLLICLAILAAGPGQAQERPPRLGEQPETVRPAARPAQKDDKAGKTLKDDKAAKDDKPVEDAKAEAKADAKAAKKPVRRRAVPMIVDRMPGPAAPAVYGPVLSVPSPAPMPATITPLAPPAPVILNGCDAGGCNGSNGVRYNGGVGTTLLSPEGRLCHKNGVTVQC